MNRVTSAGLPRWAAYTSRASSPKQRGRTTAQRPHPFDKVTLSQVERPRNGKKMAMLGAVGTAVRLAAGLLIPGIGLAGVLLGGLVGGITGVATGRNIAARNPAATLFEAPQAGHVDVYESDGFKEALREFAAKSQLV